MPQRFIHQDFAPYFVTTVVKNRRWVFQTLREASALGDIIRDSCRRLKFELLAYCILPNHIHLLIQKRGEWILPQLMQQLKGTYAYQRREGHFWQSRYHARVVDTEERLRNAILYIQMNYQKMDLSEVFGKSPFLFINMNSINAAFGV